MGRDKATLPFGGDRTLLERVVKRVSEVVPLAHIVCVAAPNQSLPALPATLRICADPAPDLGPLAALAAGLAACDERIDAVYVTGCDSPLLVPAFVARMFDLLNNHAIAAPYDGQRWHPLAAVYRTAIRPSAEALIAAGERSLVALLEANDTRRVAPEELRDADAELLSLMPCNTPAEYRAALARQMTRSGFKTA
jgi:molybdopterin-guanine dinucleotide biosynthesis protein A